MSSSTTLEPGVICKEKYGCDVPHYRDTQYCVLHLPSADKSVDFERALKKKLSDQNFDLRGVWFPAKADLSHFPFTAEVNFANASFNGDADFRFATFSGEATFRETRFCAKVQFDSATFEKPVTFRKAIFFDEARFNSATFKQRVNFESRFRAKTDFSQTQFGEVAGFTNVSFKKDVNFYKAKFVSISRFDGAVFKQLTTFDQAIFHERVNFNSARFVKRVSFEGAIFQDRSLFDSVEFRAEANFYLCNFRGSVRFKGSTVFRLERHPNFREVKFDHPRLVTFHSLTLRPLWFVEVNATEFAFTNVNWQGDLLTIDDDVTAIITSHRERPAPNTAYLLLSVTCWNLAVNAEENHRYEEASKFRCMAMESRRRALIRHPDASGKRRFKHFWSSRITLPNVYRLLSGYGENIQRALLVLIVIWAVFGVIYAIFLLDTTGAPLGWRGFPYSAAVLTLQEPEPGPSPGIAQALVTIETIMGPVQAALLALAIRRKFMR